VELDRALRFDGAGRVGLSCALRLFTRCAEARIAGADLIGSAFHPRRKRNLESDKWQEHKAS
jgi:hypothetical protein